MPELTLDDVTLHYDQSGEGSDIVWLAAGDHPGSNWRRWQVPAFEPGWRNTTYDARGVGATASRTPSPWPIEVHAGDVARLIEASCEPPVALVGLSMGSLIAVQLAHDRPDLVRCAAVMGTCVRKTGFILEWEEAEIRLRREGGIAAAPTSRRRTTRCCYYPAEVLGDDERWRELRSFIAADFEARDGRDAGRPVAGLPRLRLVGAPARDDACRSTRSRSRRTCRRRRSGCARSPSSRRTGTSTCCRASGTARRSDIVPTWSTRTVREIISALPAAASAS